MARLAAAGLLAVAMLLPAAAAAKGILTMGGGVASPVTASMASNLLAQQQAASVAAQSQSELSKISAALNAVRAAQTAARNLAIAAPSSVPDGLQSGGLVPDSGLASAGTANPVQDWTGASTPTQTTSGGQTTVTVNQTAAQAILSWNSFNVGKNTTVQFNQQQSTWVALNRISASGVPSQILGSIKAPGQVYLIDPNGIIFGGASQINVGALVASSAAISDSQFTNDGIYSTQTGTDYNPSFTDAGGPVTVEAGAQITTAEPAGVTTGGGFVLLMGTNVSNAGAITTPDGQTELVAGDNFLLRPGVSTTSNETSTTLGNEVAVELDDNGSSLTGGSGTVSNSGVITSDTGDITMDGETVVQNGVLLSTTTVATRGTIHLLSSASDPYSNVTLGSDALTLIEPDLTSTATALDSQRAAEIAQSATENALRNTSALENFDDLSLLPDQEEDLRIEIVSGNTVEFQDGSQTVAQGGQVAVSAVNRIQTDSGATIDVAGTYDFSLPVSANDIAVNIQGFEQRDDSQNRLTQNLNNSAVWVDDRDLSIVPAGTGGDASQRDYTDGGVLEVSGNLGTTGHEIGEWTAVGGTITFETGTNGAIVAQSGSVFNIDGGSIQYQAGLVDQSYLLGENGMIYNVNTAPAYITYVGVFDGFVDDHAAWGVTQTYVNVLHDPPAIEEPGYTEGRDAGTLILDSPTTVFNATLDAGVVNGSQQTSQAPAGVTDPYTLAQSVVAESGVLEVGNFAGNGLDDGTTDVMFGGVDDTADGLTLTSQIPSTVTGTSNFNAAAISQASLGGLDVLTNGTVSVTAPLTFAPGATVSLYGSAVTIAADVTDPSGPVSAGNYIESGSSEVELAATDPSTGASTTGDVELANDAEIDTAGLWTNLALDPSGPNDTAFINGGAVSLVSATNMELGTGSLIDASAGAVIAENGVRTGGTGGAVSLTLPSLTTAPETGDLALDGTLTSTGFTAGGALTLDAPNFDIGDMPASTDPSVVTLQSDFFQSGFSSYDLSGQITFAPGTTLDVVEPTEQFTDASAAVPTGGDTATGAVLALLPVYAANPQLTSISQRPGASLTLSSTDTLDLDAASSITVDPGQTISLTSYGQMTIDGDLTAPDGTVDLTDAMPLDGSTPVTYEDGVIQSVWIGATSQINVAAVPFTAANAAGNSVAIAPNGGTINITGNDGVVIVQAGAVLDAAGTNAVEQPNASVNPSPVLGKLATAGTPIDLASAGGSIELASNNGLFLYGTMLAPAGGPNAAGGTLDLTLNTDNLVTQNLLPDGPRTLTITQADTAPALPAGLAPGAASAALPQGTAQISAAQIDAGGFGTLDFSALSAFVFQGNVTLSAAQSITLAQGYITDSSDSGSVVVAAPYVMLNGNFPTELGYEGATVYLQSIYPTAFSPVNSTGSFIVDAGLIDLINNVRFGGVETALGEQTQGLDLYGFDTVTLDSTGDMRFLQTPSAAITDEQTTLISTGNINLSASVIYGASETTPDTGPSSPAVVIAGYEPTTGNEGVASPGYTLTISQPAGNIPVEPDDIGGSLVFLAATIADSGVVWNPLGSIQFGSAAVSANIVSEGDPSATIELLPGSLTSVSAAGLTIPYGGTADGVDYEVDGVDATINSSGTGLASVALDNSATGSIASGAERGAIDLEGLQIDISKGATLDLSGGGTLTGEGFISGEGGSVDVLAAPLLEERAGGGVTEPSLTADPVYAIVVGVQPEVAPVQDNTQTGATGSTPAAGEQIIIPAGVPGLPAGRYTLLPATYALDTGGYRVEFDGAANLAASPVLALSDGSYAVTGETSIVNTGVESSLPLNLTITPAATVQNYADYDTESYSQFLVADAAQIGEVRPVLPEDAGSLDLIFPALDTVSLNDAGTTVFTPASGGEGGTLSISVPINTTVQYAIYGAAAPAPQAGVVALSAATIDAFDATSVDITGTGVTLEPGATLTAAQVVLSGQQDGITLEDGSEIDTLGQGSLLIDSTELGPLSSPSDSVLNVGNGYITYSTASGSDLQEFGPITIDSGATIYTDGSIAFATGGAVNISTGAIYGGAYLDLAVPEINIGDAVAVGATAPAGLTLTQAVLQLLTDGVPASGVPATQILVLSASDAVNFFGTTGLDLSGGNVQLVIDTPAIYGYGVASDVTTISAGTIVWNGDAMASVTASGESDVSSPPGGVLANGAGTGDGTLDFDANTIVFGYSDLDRVVSDVALDRLTLGFATVNLNAASEITANNQGSLAVYQSQAQYGSAGTGGVLNLNTPLLTGADAATMAFTAGGALNVTLPAGSAPATALPENAAGAELDLTAATININSAVILPSGKLNLQTNGDIVLGAAANLNLAGDVSAVLGATTYGAGGSFIAASATGNITQAAGSVINVSATNNEAGSVALTAEGAGAGAVALNGTLTGSETGSYSAGSFTVDAQTVEDFASLNAALDNGGFFDARSFDIGQGDLTIGDGLEAQTVNVSVDNGSLTVTGTIDASFGSAGSITLAAANNLTLAPTAVLAAEGTVLQTNSEGQAIAAANTPEVSLTTSTGELTLDSGAAVDLASADGVARGDLELNVPRLGGATAGDADIATSAGLNITGAATIAVNAFETYNGLPDTVGTTSGAPDALITQAYLDQINTSDTLPFMAAVATNQDLANRLSGLTSAYDSVLHFRPGVEIASATADGDLTVEGDLDLSGFRYSDPTGYGNVINSAVYGSGEPGVLVIRAGGNLNVYGSITDGFSDPNSDVGTSFATGWVLYGETASSVQNLVVPVSVTLEAGTSLASDVTVNYAVPTTGGSFSANAIAPVALTLSGAQVTSTAFIATSNITLNGTVLFAAGQVVPAGTALPNGAVIAPGGSLPFAVTVGAVIWPANTPFTISTANPNASGAGQVVVLSAALTLLPGSVIPGNSYLKLPGKVASIATRTTVDGTEGQLYPLGQLLPDGDLSWSVQLVSGANTAAANTGAVQSTSALAAEGNSGNLTLADAHYGLGANNVPVSVFSVIRTGTGSLSLISGGSIAEDTDYGIYTAGAQSSAILNSSGANPYDLPQGLPISGTLLGSSDVSLAALEDYQANYPEDGGNVLISAQGNLNGFIFTSNVLADSDALGSWLWLQGGAGQAGAWWVEFGALEPAGDPVEGESPVTPQLDGFQGIGTLGGGNLTVNVGGDASGLNLAVASTGRVLADGTLVETGGGNLTVDIGEVLNLDTNLTKPSGDGGGLITDLQGDITLDAGSIGAIAQVYDGDINAPADDPVAVPPLETDLADVGGGIDLAPGDGTVTVDTRGDLVIDDVVNPGMQINQVNTTPVDFTEAGGQTIDTASGGKTVFSLWSADTSVALNSAGGSIAPYDYSTGSVSQNGTAFTSSDLPNLYPPSLSVVAQNGDIDFTGGTVELAPAADGTLDLLAAGSIAGAAPAGDYDDDIQTTVSISGAAPSVEATPFDPAIAVSLTGPLLYTNEPTDINDGSKNPQIMAFGLDTPTADLHADGQAPALVLAGSDILDLTIGEVTQTSGVDGSLTYAVAMPFEVAAGQDIIDSGTPASPGVFLNLGANDITTVTAGLDILDSSFDIAGPGTLLVQAGRNVYQGNDGVLDSVGPLFDIDPDNRDGGAGITVIAGTGDTGPDYAGFEALFLDPDSTLDLEDASSIIAQNDAALLTYLQTNFGYTGSAAGAYARFEQLSANQQDLFLLNIYFAMLNEGGLEFNEPSSVHYKSYIVGQDAIAALFPTTGADGQPISYDGAITMFGPSGIHTDFGGNIQTLTPGGETIVGVEGPTPPGSAGLLTQGTGNIDVYSLGSVLLGQSRIFTTFGGGILIWSADGDINAGIGAKTTVTYAPVQTIYDDYGNVALSPTVPTTGAGIGTLNPIPQVAPGNINLVAPVGTVNAGEAGIRVSGNLNVAALHVLNAANIQVQGTTTGVPEVVAPNIGGLTSAGNASGAAEAAAENVAKQRPQSDMPSIWIVEVLGYGGGDGTVEPRQNDKKKSITQASAIVQNSNSRFQVIGVGDFSNSQAMQLANKRRAEIGR